MENKSNEIENSESDNQVLRVENLVIEFSSGDQKIQAVNGVSFELNKGETLAIVGESGAGKSVVGRSIVGILSDQKKQIKQGHIWLNGNDIVAMNEKELRKIRGKQISMIFQDPMTSLNPVFTVGNQIEEAYCEHNHVSKKEARAKTEELLELVGISRTRYRDYPHQFSGGMRQRVVIAMAIACNPDVLVADEPTTALDVTIQAQILDLIYELKEKYGSSVILITHDLGIVAENCDKVMIMYAGRIVESGTKEMIFHNPLHPYTRGLFDAIPGINKGRLKQIDGLPPDPGKLPDGCCFHPRCPYANKECCCNVPELKEYEKGHFSRCNAGKEQRENE